MVRLIIAKLLYYFIKYVTVATDGSSCPTLQLPWRWTEAIWVDQWPLPKEKMQHLQELVQEQLEAGHISLSNSPWNTPFFTIQKKSGKWHLLYDLRAINNCMEDMGALQPGLPSPVMLPEK